VRLDGTVTVPERIVPDESAPGVVALHLKRYVFAEPYCIAKTVLDAGCGVGYGTAHLAQFARRVVGIDRDEASIDYASQRYGRANVEFSVMDVADLRFGDESFDVVCAFETIEHVANREAHLAEVARVLRPGGVYIVSTPRAEKTNTRPANPFHHIEFDAGDFERFLRTRFATVELYGQRRVQTTRHRLAQRLDVAGLRRRFSFLRRASAAVVGTRPTERVRPEDIAIERGRLADARELVAVCSDPRS
jgi:SAM-dependent methyltransferase